MKRTEGPDKELVEKVSQKNPAWGVNEWEVWWCKWGRKRWPHWKDMKVCDQCNCERK